MVMINCKVIDKDGGVAIVDVNSGFKIETNVNDFSTTVEDNDGIYAYIEHENLEIAMECQRQLSKVIHFQRRLP